MNKEYRDYGLIVNTLGLLDTFSATILFNFLKSSREWKGTRREKTIFGNTDIVYNINFRGRIASYPVKPWIKELSSIKEKIQNITGEIYTVCVVQYYPNGKFGINSHRDKEMVHGTTIVGLSLGAERTLEMSRNGKTISIPLPHGSIYILYPPTNDLWAHSIPPTETIVPRISLTFRNY